jgi:hypothetical protein
MKGIADWRHLWPAIEVCYFRVAMQESKIVAKYDGGWDALYFSFLYLPLFSSQNGARLRRRDLDEIGYNKRHCLRDYAPARSR